MEKEGKEREFTSLPGNRQFKIVIKTRNKINLSKVKAVLQFNSLKKRNISEQTK